MLGRRQLLTLLQWAAVRHVLHLEQLTWPCLLGRQVLLLLLLLKLVIMGLLQQRMLLLLLQVLLLRLMPSEHLLLLLYYLLRLCKLLQMLLLKILQFLDAAGLYCLLSRADSCISHVSKHVGVIDRYRAATFEEVEAPDWCIR